MSAAPSLVLSPVFALVLSVSTGFLHLFSLLLLLGLGVPNSPALIGMAAMLAYGAVFAILAARLGDAPAQTLALVPPARGYRLAVLLLLPSVVLVSELDNWTVALLPGASGESAELPQPASWTYEIALVQIVVFPMAYELFFRGLIQPGLVHTLGAVRGIAAMAGLNALGAMLAVLNPRMFPTTAVSAALLGFVRHKTGSLIPALALHALTGVVTLGAHLRLFGIGGFDDTTQAHTPAFWLLGAAALTALGLRRCNRLSPAPPPPESGGAEPP